MVKFTGAPIREGDFSIFIRNYKHLSKPSEQALLSFLFDIQGGSQEEEEGGEEHKNRRNAKTHFPSEMILDIDDGCQGNEDRNRLGSIVQAKEAFQDPVIFWVISSVQLICSKRQGTWPNATSSNGYESKRRHKDSHLDLCCRFATPF